MEKVRKTLYYFSLAISMLVGLWHFFVPHMFHWYDYLPMQYENLIVGIDYVNYCFSALLLGTSLVLILSGKSALSLDLETLEFHTMLTVIWVFRACLSLFIEPFPMEPTPVAAIGQLLLSVTMAFMMVFVDSSLWVAYCRKKKAV